MGDSKAKRDRKKLESRARHERLLRLFDEDSGYDIFETPKYVFEKRKNNDNNTWEVAIFTRESWAKRQNYTPSEYQLQIQHLRDIMKGQ